MRCIVEMSPPEQNTGPAPVTMMTRISGSRSADSIASAKAMRNSMSIALRFCGRLSVTVRTAASSSTSTGPAVVVVIGR